MTLTVTDQKSQKVDMGNVDLFAIFAVYPPSRRLNVNDAE